MLEKQAQLPTTGGAKATDPNDENPADLHTDEVQPSLDIGMHMKLDRKRCKVTGANAEGANSESAKRTRFPVQNDQAVNLQDFAAQSGMAAVEAVPALPEYSALMSEVSLVRNVAVLCLSVLSYTNIQSRRIHFHLGLDIDLSQ